MNELMPSSKWQGLADSLQRQISEVGVEHFREFEEIQRNIIYDNPEYARHAELCERHLWKGDPRPDIIEFGAGYGGMIHHWPQRVGQIINVDLDPMLAIQQWYHFQQGKRVIYMPLDNFHLLRGRGRYFFSAYALTETTPEMWDHCFEHLFPHCAGVYIKGSVGWRFDNIASWDWSRLADVFEDVYVNQTGDMNQSRHEMTFIGVAK
jgi:hypothetical protein